MNEQVQDQNSMILNPSLDSDDDVVDMEEVQQPHPVMPIAPIHQGIVRIVYGPVLPPEMIWARSFSSLLPDFLIKKVPSALPGLFLPPSVISLGQLKPDQEKRMSLLLQGPPMPASRSSVSIQEISNADSSLLTPSLPDAVSSQDSRIADSDFLFSATKPPTESMLGKRQHGGKRAHCVAPIAATPDFSTRRMTRSCAKSSGLEPLYEILGKPSPKRRPRGKKMKTSEEEPTEQAQMPPETPIPVMQGVGHALGIPVVDLTEEKLMAPSKKSDGEAISNDE